MRSRNLASAIAIVLLVAGCGAAAPSRPAAPFESPSSPPAMQTAEPSVQPSPSLRPGPSGVVFDLSTFP